MLDEVWIVVEYERVYEYKWGLLLSFDGFK